MLFDYLVAIQIFVIFSFEKEGAPKNYTIFAFTMSIDFKGFIAANKLAINLQSRIFRNYMKKINK